MALKMLFFGLIHNLITAAVCQSQWKPIWLPNCWEWSTTRVISRPTHFFHFIDIPPKICSNCPIYLHADTVIYTSSGNISAIERTLQWELASPQKWILLNKCLLNKTKSCGMLFGNRAGLGEASELSFF